MFDACEGCGGIPDHPINGSQCVANRAESVREEQTRLEAERASDERLYREHEEMLREMVD